MSSEHDKEKHSKRLHRENSAIERQVRISKDRGIKIDEPHKLAKRHAMDCGQPGCYLCGNPRKLFKEKTIQEQRFEQEKIDYDPDQ